METDKIKQKFSWSSKSLAIISYLGVLSLLAMILREKNKSVHFHVRQGVTLFVAEIIFTLIMVIPLIGWLIGFIGWILCVFFSIIGLLKAAKGQEWSIPFFGKIATKVKI